MNNQLTPEALAAIADAAFNANAGEAYSATIEGLDYAQKQIANIQSNINEAVSALHAVEVIDERDLGAMLKQLLADRAALTLAHDAEVEALRRVLNTVARYTDSGEPSLARLGQLARAALATPKAGA